MTLIALFEYGSHRFGGYGRRFFTGHHHNDIAYMIRRRFDDGEPAQAKDAVIDFFCDTFERDNSSFNKKKFLAHLENVRPSSATFQQRHYYFLAECIKHQPPHFREYLARLLGDNFDRRGEGFREALWYKVCSVSDAG